MFNDFMVIGVIMTILVIGCYYMFEAPHERKKRRNRW